MDLPKLSNSHIAIGILAALVFADWIAITPHFMTKKDFQEELRVQLYGGVPYNIAAPGFMLTNDEGDTIGMFKNIGGIPTLTLINDGALVALSANKGKTFVQLESEPGQIARLAIVNEVTALTLDEDKNNGITIMTDKAASFIRVKHQGKIYDYPKNLVLGQR